MKHKVTDQSGYFENTHISVYLLFLYFVYLILGEGRMVRRPCVRLSGQGSSTGGRGDRSLEPSRF
jgi:hypothetical protein